MCDWIDKNDLDAAVNRLLDRARNAVDQAEERQIRNVVDPFQSLVVSFTFELQDVNQFQGVQNANSGLRGLSNAIGDFHQDVLSSIDGWDNHDAGYDLECEGQQIIAEVKNKHNTLNANDRRGVIRDLETAIRQKGGRPWRAYLVEIIPKQPRRYENVEATQVWAIDGASFYHLATGRENALRELFDALCDRIETTAELLNHCHNLFRDSIA